MAFVAKNSQIGGSKEQSVAPGVILMAATVVVAGFALLLNSDLTDNFPYFYLLPWIAVLGVVLASPSVYLYFKGRFSLHDPLIFATWSYFLPAFFVGGLMLASGWSPPAFLVFIQDSDFNLPYTVVLIILGFVGLSIGYFSPLGEKAGASIGRFLPKKDFESRALLTPAVVLLVLGTLNTAGALILGIIGYQKSDALETYTGILYLTTLLWMQGSFMGWYLVFRIGKVNSRTIAVVVFLVVTTIGKAAFAGNRASLLQAVISVILAYTLAGRKFNFKRSVAAGTLMVSCLLIGMIYGTTFRNVKGTESRVSIDQYTDNIFETFDQVGSFDFRNNLEFGLVNLAERLDTLSSVAVVVSNYEQLAPYEESYGLDNNIWKDLSTFFIPRVLWNDKPVASEPRKYSDLYFNFGESSFAITPIGDLLRNFGPVGVPIGMFFLGLIIRFIYRALIEGQPQTMWRASMYFMLLVSISYEGFYGNIVSYLFKVGVTAAVGLLIVGLIARALGHSRVLDPA